MINILHLSQTDIKSDSRILKEMAAVSSSKRKVFGIGVEKNTDLIPTSSRNIKVDSIRLISRQLRLIPELLKNILVVFEITLKMFWKSVKLEPKIIHCHDTPVLPLGVILKCFTGAKIIYDAHELESERNGLSRLAGRITLFVEKRSWRFIDRLVVVSPSILSWYHENIGKKNSVIVLNSPTMPQQQNNNKKRYLRTKFSIPEDAVIFIYNGVFTRGRGLELVARVFQQHNIRSHIVFLGFGDMKEELLGWSKVHEKIHVHDAVAHEDVVAINQSANVGVALIENVSLSDYFCLPNKLFEYAFAGIHVLASNFPDIAAVVKKHNLGECSDLDYESIFSAVSKFERKGVLIGPDIKDIDILSWEAQDEKLNKMYAELSDEIGEFI